MTAAADFAWRRLSVAVLLWLVPAVTIWPLLHDDAVGFLLDNELDADLRSSLFRACLVSVAVGAAGYGVHAWRTAPGPGRIFHAFGRANRALLPLAALPAVPFLTVPKVEKLHPFWTWIAIGALLAAAGVGLGRLLRGIEDERVARLARWSAPAAPVVAVGAGIVYAWKIASIALAHHVHMRTQIYDLGIYDNLLWNSTFGEFLRCSFIKGGHHTAAHFDPALYLLTPLYRLAPRAETLLVIQAVWIAAGVVPLYRIGSRNLGSPWLGAWMAVLYTLYPALHGANLFDFHSITLAIPTILWVVYLVDAGSRWWYVPAFLLLLAIREDMALLSCFIGFYAIWARKRPWLGLATILVALSYLWAVKQFVMPDSALLMKATRTTYSYIYFYKDMIPDPDEGARGLVVSFFTNPVFVLRHALSEDKIAYLLAIFVPLLGLPLLARNRYPLYAYGALFILLSSRRHMYSIHFQYNAVVIPFVLVGAAEGLRAAAARVRSVTGVRARLGIGTLALLAVLLSGAKYGILAPNKSFRAGWEPPLRDPPQNVLDRYAWFYHKVRELIPPDAPVSASSRLGPHVSNRADVYRFPVIRNAQFVLVFSKDMGKKEKAALKRMKNRRRFERVAKKFGIEIYRRKEKRRPSGAARRAGAQKPGGSVGSGNAGGSVQRVPALPKVRPGKAPGDPSRSAATGGKP